MHQNDLQRFKGRGRIDIKSWHGEDWDRNRRMARGSLLRGERRGKIRPTAVMVTQALLLPETVLGWNGAKRGGAEFCKESGCDAGPVDGLRFLRLVFCIHPPLFVPLILPLPLNHRTCHPPQFHQPAVRHPAPAVQGPHPQACCPSVGAQDHRPNSSVPRHQCRDSVQELGVGLGPIANACPVPAPRTCNLLRGLPFPMGE